jgi:hypothetical protein
MVAMQRATQSRTMGLHTMYNKWSTSRVNKLFLVFVCANSKMGTKLGSIIHNFFPNQFI